MIKAPFHHRSLLRNSVLLVGMLVTIVVALPGCKKERDLGDQAPASATGKQPSAQESPASSAPLPKEASRSDVTSEKELASKARDALSAVGKAAHALRQAKVAAGKAHVKDALTALEALEKAEPSIHFARTMMDSVGTHELDETIPLEHQPV